MNKVGQAQYLLWTKILEILAVTLEILAVTFCDVHSIFCNTLVTLFSRFTMLNQMLTPYTVKRVIVKKTGKFAVETFLIFSACTYFFLLGRKFYRVWEKYVELHNIILYLAMYWKGFLTEVSDRFVRFGNHLSSLCWPVKFRAVNIPLRTKSKSLSQYELGNLLDCIRQRARVEHCTACIEHFMLRTELRWDSELESVTSVSFISDWQTLGNMMLG
jgi:hypothetical protein